MKKIFCDCCRKEIEVKDENNMGMTATEVGTGRTEWEISPYGFSVRKVKIDADVCEECKVVISKALHSAWKGIKAYEEKK